MKKIVRLDPSTLALTGCWRNVQLRNVLGYEPRIKSAPLSFGSILHKAAASWRTANALGTPLNNDELRRSLVRKYTESPTNFKAPRMPEDLDTILRGYLEYLSDTRDEGFKPLVVTKPDGSREVSVEKPYEIPFVTTPEVTVLLCGVVDAIGILPSGRQVLLDTKHSNTTWISGHLDEMSYRKQFIIYSYVLRQLGFPANQPGYAPVVVDGIYISPKLPKAASRFQRSDPIDIHAHVVDRVILEARFKAELLANFASLSAESIWPHDYDQCDGKYEPCMFKDICRMVTDQQQPLLDMFFTKRVYDPRTFGE